MIVRVVVAGADPKRDAAAEIRRALTDPDVSSLVIHKPGAVHLTDGREVLFDAAGRLVK